MVEPDWPTGDPQASSILAHATNIRVDIGNLHKQMRRALNTFQAKCSCSSRSVSTTFGTKFSRKLYIRHLQSNRPLFAHELSYLRQNLNLSLDTLR